MHGIMKIDKVIKGKVWEVLVPKQDASSLMKRYRVVKNHNQNNGVYMRIVSDLKPHDEAIAVIPDLDDLYLYYFVEEVAYD